MLVTEIDCITSDRLHLPCGLATLLHQLVLLKSVVSKALVVVGDFGDLWVQIGLG